MVRRPSRLNILIAVEFLSVGTGEPIAGIHRHFCISIRYGLWFLMGGAGTAIIRGVTAPFERAFAVDHRCHIRRERMLGWLKVLSYRGALRD